MCDDFKFETTEDLQHDYALCLSGDFPDYEMAKEIKQELINRKALIPVNCRLEHNIYARFKQELKYDLPD